MDTDDLSEEAYEVLIIARGINEFLWVELGALSSKYQDEEGYLKGALKFIRKIRKVKGDVHKFINCFQVVVIYKRNKDMLL